MSNFKDQDVIDLVECANDLVSEIEIMRSLSATQAKASGEAYSLVDATSGINPELKALETVLKTFMPLTP